MHLLIFVCLGSQQYPFDRLLKELDQLKNSGEIREDIFAQIGSSHYVPQSYYWERFITQEVYEKKLDEASLVISHGGTGAIVKALKKGKKVIAVPRRAKYGEHADDHQFQIVDFLYENGYVYKVVEMSELKKAIEEAMGSAPLKAFTSTGHIIDIIEDFINHS